MQDFNDKARPPPRADYQKELVKLFNGMAGRHGHWKVFADFCEIAAITLSNAVDWAHREEREQRYLQLVKDYNREELDAFARGLAHLTMAMETQTRDVLGRTYHDLELHNKWAGQYFTPDAICRMMARMTVGDAEHLKERIAARGFITAQEPAVGSGAMLIALAQEMVDAGINYQQHLHVTAVDIDPKCVHMAYVQFSLLHIPAVIIHGDTLSLKEYSHWYTPAHILDGWQRKLRQQEALDGAFEILTTPPVAVLPQAVEPPPKLDGPAAQLTLF
jgi:hypothetical protein